MSLLPALRKDPSAEIHGIRTKHCAPECGEHQCCSSVWYERQWKIPYSHHHSRSEPVWLLFSYGEPDIRWNGYRSISPVSQSHMQEYSLFSFFPPNSAQSVCLNSRYWDVFNSFLQLCRITLHLKALYNAADNSGASSTSCISITHKKVSYYNKILLKRTAPAGESGRILPAGAVLII